MIRKTLFLCAALAIAAAGPAGAAPEFTVDPDDPTAILPIERFPGAIDRMLRDGEYDKALKYADEGLKQNPLSVQLRFQRSVILERLGRTGEAKKELERMILRYPEIPEPYNNLAAIHSREGDLDRAEELLKRALVLRPNFALAYANLGNLYLAHAKNAWKKSLQLRKNEPLAQRLESLQALIDGEQKP